MYKVLAILNVDSGLRICNRANNPDTSKVCLDSQAFYEKTVDGKKECTCMHDLSKCCAPIGLKHTMQR